MEQLTLFSQRLRMLMDEFRITKSKLNNDCNLNNNHIKYWEDNRVVPKFDILDRLARYFNVSTAYLAGYSDEIGKYSNDELNDSPAMKALEDAIFRNNNKDEEIRIRTYAILTMILSNMNREQLDKVLDYAQYIASKK